MDGHHLDHHADGKTRALDAIRAGGDQLIATVRQRVVQVLDALEAGDFVRALSALADAEASVGALVHAQQYIAIAQDAKIVLAADVQPGMTLMNVGEVTEVDVEECADERCRRHITIKVGEHELKFIGDNEVFVAATGDDGRDSDHIVG